MNNCHTDECCGVPIAPDCSRDDLLHLRRGIEQQRVRLDVILAEIDRRLKPLAVEPPANKEDDT